MIEVWCWATMNLSGVGGPHGDVVPLEDVAGQQAGGRMAGRGEGRHQGAPVVVRLGEDARPVLAASTAALTRSAHLPSGTV